MNLREHANQFEKYISSLTFKTKYESEKNRERPNFAENLQSLREAILNLDGINILDYEINKLKNSTLFRHSGDTDYFDNVEDSVIRRDVNNLRIGLEFLLRYIHQLPHQNNGINIKLPEVKDFDDLGKIAKDLKKAIEIPISDQQMGGEVKIESADSGSIWLMISVGTIASVNLVGAICWSAAVIRKKLAEAKMFKEHAKTLELKNDMMMSLVEAQKIQIKNILDSEAKEIVSNHYNLADGEAVSRLKLSIETVSELIDKGAKIIPSSTDAETKKLFPDYSNLNLIESTIRQLNRSAQ